MRGDAQLHQIILTSASARCFLKSLPMVLTGLQCSVVGVIIAALTLGAVRCPAQQLTNGTLFLTVNDNYGNYSAVLDFPYQSFIRGFRVTDKEEHENHSHKRDQPGYDHNRIEGVSRSRLSQIGKMPN